MRTILAALLLTAISCGTAFGKAERWNKLTEDADLAYLLDDKSILKTKAGTSIFWMKLVSRKKDFLKNEYKISDLDYILFNYEIDCDRGMYKPRGVIYYDRNGKQLDKQAPISVDMTDAEPIPPESIMELAQRYICEDSDKALPQQQVPLPQETGETPAPELSPALQSAPEAQPEAR